MKRRELPLFHFTLLANLAFVLFSELLLVLLHLLLNLSLDPFFHLLLCNPIGARADGGGEWMTSGTFCEREQMHTHALSLLLKTSPFLEQLKPTLDVYCRLGLLYLLASRSSLSSPSPTESCSLPLGQRQKELRTLCP